MRRLDERGKIILLSFLLLLVLGLLVWCAAHTVQQVRGFQQHSQAVKTGDVSTVRPWMTVRNVSHIYAVPENYLNQELGLQAPEVAHRPTLNTIAKTSHKPVTTVIQTVQHAIVKYRQAHPHASPPPTKPKPPGPKSVSLSPQGERWQA